MQSGIGTDHSDFQFYRLPFHAKWKKYFADEINYLIGLFEKAEKNSDNSLEHGREDGFCDRLASVARVATAEEKARILDTLERVKIYAFSRIDFVASLSVELKMYMLSIWPPKINYSDSEWDALYEKRKDGKYTATFAESYQMFLMTLYIHEDKYRWARQIICDASYAIKKLNYFADEKEEKSTIDNASNEFKQSKSDERTLTELLEFKALPTTSHDMRSVCDSLTKMYHLKTTNEYGKKAILTKLKYLTQCSQDGSDICDALTALKNILISTSTPQEKKYIINCALPALRHWGLEVKSIAIDIIRKGALQLDDISLCEALMDDVLFTIRQPKMNDAAFVKRIEELARSNKEWLKYLPQEKPPEREEWFMVDLLVDIYQHIKTLSPQSVVVVSEKKEEKKSESAHRYGPVYLDESVRFSEEDKAKGEGTIVRHSMFQPLPPPSYPAAQAENTHSPRPASPK